MVVVATIEEQVGEVADVKALVIEGLLDWGSVVAALVDCC